MNGEGEGMSTAPVGTASSANATSAGDAREVYLVPLLLDTRGKLICVSAETLPVNIFRGWACGKGIDEWLPALEDRSAVLDALAATKYPVCLPVTLQTLDGRPVAINLQLTGTRIEDLPAAQAHDGQLQLTGARIENQNSQPQTRVLVRGLAAIPRDLPNPPPPAPSSAANAQTAALPGRSALAPVELTALPLVPDSTAKPYRASFLWLLLPFLSFIFLGLIIFVERMGMRYTVSGGTLNFLASAPAAVAPASQPAQCLILFDSQGPGELEPLRQLKYTFASMRVNCAEQDLRDDADLSLRSYRQVVMASPNMDLIGDQIEVLDNWVRSGGKLLFAIRPDPGVVFQGFYRKIGIRSLNGNLVNLSGIIGRPGFMPGLPEEAIGNEFLNHSSIPGDLDPQSAVYATSGDAYHLPLVWSFPYGQGKVVVLNSDQFLNRASAGVVASAFSLAGEPFAWPVVNSSVIFLEDFPGPLPLASHENLTRFYGRDIRSFFVNVWWPDMNALAQKYQLKYTGLMVESFSNNVKPPFLPEGESDTFQYLGASLLDSGGEIATQGFNKVPLCLEQELPPNAEAIAWPTSDDMQFGVAEGFRFVLSLFPQQPAVTLAPAEGILCGDALRWLPGTDQSMRVLSGKYLNGGAADVPEMDFAELPSGLISYPRISSGIGDSEYDRWIAANALTLLYVHSQSINANAPLGNDALAKAGWETMRESIDNSFLDMFGPVKGLRQLTAREGAMAVQRYDRLYLQQTADARGLHLKVTNLEDEAWLMLRSEKALAKIPDLIDLGHSLYLLRVSQPEITLSFEGSK